MAQDLSFLRGIQLSSCVKTHSPVPCPCGRGKEEPAGFAWRQGGDKMLRCGGVTAIEMTLVCQTQTWLILEDSVYQAG